MPEVATHFDGIVSTCKENLVLNNLRKSAIRGKICCCGPTFMAVVIQPKNTDAMTSSSSTLQIRFFFVQKVRNLLSSKKVRDVDAVRLVMLYALRYEKHSNNDISGLIGVLQRRGVPEKLLKVTEIFIIIIIGYCHV